MMVTGNGLVLEANRSKRFIQRVACVVKSAGGGLPLVKTLLMRTADWQSRWFQRVESQRARHVGTPRLEYILRDAILALLDQPEATLADVLRGLSAP
jgi:hypothetical protein